MHIMQHDVSCNSSALSHALRQILKIQVSRKEVSQTTSLIHESPWSHHVKHCHELRQHTTSDALNVPVQPDSHAFTGAACAFGAQLLNLIPLLAELQLYSHAPPLPGYLSQCSAVHHAKSVMCLLMQFTLCPPCACFPNSLYILRPSPTTGLAFKVSM